MTPSLQLGHENPGLGGAGGHKGAAQPWIPSLGAPPTRGLTYLGRQLAPVRVFVIPQDGAPQPVGQVNADLVLHP